MKKAGVKGFYDIPLNPKYAVVIILLTAAACLVGLLGGTGYAKANTPFQDGSADVNLQPEIWQTVTMRVTAYCPCPKCCGEYSDGQTACGHIIQPGDTFIAADRRYSFNTEMIIPDYNNQEPVKVLDRGGAIRGDRLDVFFATHEEALKWGVRYVDVKIRCQ